MTLFATALAFGRASNNHNFEFPSPPAVLIFCKRALSALLLFDVKPTRG